MRTSVVRKANIPERGQYSGGRPAQPKFAPLFERVCGMSKLKALKVETGSREAAMSLYSTAYNRGDIHVTLRGTIAYLTRGEK